MQRNKGFQSDVMKRSQQTFSGFKIQLLLKGDTEKKIHVLFRKDACFREPSPGFAPILIWNLLIFKVILHYFFSFHPLRFMNMS